MAGAPLADTATLAGWLGLGTFIPNSDDEKRAATIISVISDLARGEAENTSWSLETVPGNVSAIVLMVAASCFPNPDRKSSITIEEVTRRWESGDLFSATELSTLRGFRAGASSGLWSMQVTRGHKPQRVSTPVQDGKPVHLYDGLGY